MSADPDQLPVPTGHFIDGRLVRTGAWGMEVRRPSDGKPYATLVRAITTNAGQVCVAGFGKDLGRQAVEANLRHKSVLIDLSTA